MQELADALLVLHSDDGLDENPGFPRPPQLLDAVPGRQGGGSKRKRATEIPRERERESARAREVNVKDKLRKKRGKREKETAWLDQIVG